MTELTAARLRELLHYDSETGEFTRRTIVRKVSASAKKGDGYVYISVDGHRYRAHRLAWLYVTGNWPAHGLDHRDGDKTNNRFANLREASQLANTQNQRRPHRDNKLGLLGVSQFRNRYRAQIQTAGQLKRLGWFDTPEEAHAAYVAAKRREHPGCTI
jgi:hypothetical protein